MLKVTFITPTADFPNLVVKVAATNHFMPIELFEYEDLENYVHPSRLETVSALENKYQDMLKKIPEFKESLGEKLKRVYTARPVIKPLFEDWSDLCSIHSQLDEMIDELSTKLQEFNEKLKELKQALELHEQLIKGFNLLEETQPYDLKEDEAVLVGVLSTSSKRDAEEFLVSAKTKEVISLGGERFLLYAKDRREIIEKIAKSLEIVNFIKFERKCQPQLTAAEIAEILLKEEKEIEKQIQLIEKEQKNYIISHNQQIVAIELSIRSYGMLLHTYTHARKTEKTVIFRGWIPEQAMKQVYSILEAFPTTVVITKEPDEEKDLNIPVELSRNPIVSSFQMITGMYGYPSPKEVDPTIILMFTFSLFFGIMFGDAGHGLIFVVIGLAGMLAKGLKASVRKMFIAVFSLGLTTVLLGTFVFGEFFGYEIAELLNIHEIFGFHYPPLHPVEDISEIFNLVLIIGAIHVALGLTLRMLNQLYNRKFKELLEETWAQMFLYIAILYFLAYVEIIDFGIDIPGLVFLISITIGLVLALLGRGIAWMILKHREESFISALMGGIGMGVMHLLETFSGFISNTISYGRLLAMLIAHSVFLAVINTLASGTFIVVQIVILIIGNIFVLALEGLLAFVQDIRLHYYEWFSKFYSGQGVEHVPLFIFNQAIRISE